MPTAATRHFTPIYTHADDNIGAHHILEAPTKDDTTSKEYLLHPIFSTVLKIQRSTQKNIISDIKLSQ